METMLPWFIALACVGVSAGFNISRAFIIALEPATAQPLVLQIQQHLRIADVRVIRAVNATQALSMTTGRLPLYTLNLLRWGRHDHMQVYSGGSLGCLLSHVSVWGRVGPNETVAVFEEDAIVDELSAVRLGAVLGDLAGVPWDLLMLESGHLGLNGVWRYVGKNAATCADWGSKLRAESCSWMGSRGYAIRQHGALQLMEHATPYTVQTDALMGLLATFSPNFTMYWTTANIAHPTYMRPSSIWDGCVKCYLPVSAAVYLAALCFAVSVAVVVWVSGHRKGVLKPSACVSLSAR